MESVKPSGFSGDMEKKKVALNSPLRRKVSSAKVSASDEIPTPEKVAQLPRRASKRRLLLSVGDVRRVAMGMRMTRNKSANSSDLPRSHGELQRKSQSSSDSAARKTRKLSENYEMLAEFFNCLDSSVQLLRLKGALATFTNISASIQHLTERRFTYRHLAQMKHILPEAISIKKVLLHDEATGCMKPELQVSLQVGSLESNPELRGESPYSAVRKVFRDRLVQFAREHPEKDDIPEETLPHPFGRTSLRISTESSKLAPSIQTGSFSVAHPAENLTKVSHFSVSFQRRFSTRSVCSDEIKTPLASFNDVVTNVDLLASSFPSPIKLSSKPPIQKKPLFSSPGKRPLVHDHQIEEDLNMLISAHNSISSEVKSLESTPVKDIPSSARLMITTPDLQTPKRSRILSIDDTPQKALVKRPTRTKLFPTPRKNVKSDGKDNLSKSSPVADDVLGFLPESLLQDIRDKEKNAMEERDANVAGATLRKKMIASLPKLFDSILLIFQSGNRSIITKQELVHKILSCNCSVIDRNEVEEQLKLMEELVPDWIFRKVAATGDILYRYEMLAEFFNCLDSSVQLLRLKGALATFTNISASIQHLTERRFTYRHLAQMKHILPEAISIKKVLLHDEATGCMKPELQVSLQVGSLESNPELRGESPYSAVRKVFRDRLVQFAREHPEKDDIPEETLSHPFGRTSLRISTESSKLAPSIQTGSFSVAHPAENLTKVSHFSASFQRRFSTRSVYSDEIKTPLASFNDVVTNVDLLASSFPSPIKFSSKPPIQKKPLFSSPGKRPLVTHDHQIVEDSKMLISAPNSISSEVKSLESTPVKDILSSARLMITTPDLQTPKRSRITSIDDTPQKALVKWPTRTKLFPTPRKNVKSDGKDNLSKSSPVADDVLGFLPESLLQDIRDKEKKAMEERDANVAGATLRKKMIASLPKLFDSILLIFQSGNRSVITKQELVHKILSCNCSVIDRNEVEEQLKLMEELVPDWIFRKAAATGDILYRVNKMSSSQEIRQRLAVAE